MNKVYQVVWNKAKRVWQAASELSQQGGKGSGRSSVCSSRAIAAGTLFLFALPLQAADLPSGGQVVGGQGSISSAGNTLTVSQNSQNLAVDWQDFSIAEGHSVIFVQPNAQAAALNRVTGDNVSDIRGAINANGRVFLVNPNGVMFSSTARVDVGALVASTLDISTEDFMAGNYQFDGASANAIINHGNITTAQGGVVAMIAAKIINTGNVTTPGGSTLMGAGSKVTLDLGGPVKIEVEEALLETYIEQGGAIRADGGLVYLTAKAAGNLASSVINHTGITEARTLAAGADGRIMLMGDMDSGQVQVAGTLDASAPTAGDGGFIETSAARVDIVTDVIVSTKAGSGKTGEWLIDPVNLTIAASGGNITGATIANALQSTNVTLDTSGSGSCIGVTCSPTGTDGDIFVNDDIKVAAGETDSTLTLKANRNVIVEADVEISSTSGKLNTVLWADIDNTDGGMIWMKKGSVINTNGGHLWMGGGSDSITWNGLTVGDSHATGNSVNSNGIVLIGTNLATNGGDMAFYGRGRPGNYSSTATYSPDEIFYNSNGIRLESGNSINAASGTIHFDGYTDAVAVAGSANGIEFSAHKTDTITSSSDANIAIFIEGRALNNAASNNAWGFYSWVAQIESSGQGGIHIKGSGAKNAGVTIASEANIKSSSGNIVLEGLGSGAANPFDILIQGDLSSNSGGINLIADSLDISGTLASNGALNIRTRSAGRKINIGGNDASALQLAGSYFSSNFADGFASITIGDEHSDTITVGGAVAYRDDLIIKSGKNILLNDTANLTGSIGQNASLTLWARVGGNQDANDSRIGNVWLTEGAKVATNGGDIVIGGGTDPLTGNAKGDITASAEGNAITRGAAINGTLDAGGGDISIRGRGRTGLAGRGVSIAGDVRTEGMGNITIHGYASGGSDAVAVGDSAPSLNNQAGSIIAENGTIFIFGQRGSGKAINVNSGSSITNSGMLILNGLDGAGDIDALGNNHVIADSLLIRNARNVTLSSNLNDINTLAADDLANLIYINKDAMRIGTVNDEGNDYQGIGASGSINIATLSGDLVVAENIVSGSGADDAITLNAGKNAAAGTATGGDIQISDVTISAGTGGRATLYTGSLSGSTGMTEFIGSGSGRFRYNSDEASTGYSTVLGTGLYAIYREQPTLLVGADSDSVSYGSSLPSSYTAAYAGFANGDSSAILTGTAAWLLEAGATSTSGNRVVGSYDVTYTGGLSNGLGYAIANNNSGAGTVTVTKRVLDMELAGTSSRVYDGTTGMDFSGYTVSADGMISGDDLVVDTKSVGGVVDKNVGTNKQVTFSGFDLSGADAGNYQLVSDAASTTASITQKAITISGITAANKVYNASTNAIVNSATASGWLIGDDVQVSASGQFSDKHAGTDKTVTLTSSYSGEDAGNYVITDQTSTTASITQKAITISGITAADKVYNASTDATVNSATANGWLIGDDVQVSASGQFADKHAGTDKTVTLTSSYSGEDAGNYVITDQTSTTASISQKAITISGITAADKVYNASTDAIVNSASASGWITGDDVQVAATGQFADKNAAADKVVNLTSSYSGDDAGNYVITDQTSTTASISQKAITISGITAADKVYDASTDATVNSATASGWIAGDDVQVSASGQFADKHAGTDKTVTLTSSYSGEDAGNYVITDQTSTTASITQKAITISGITAADKVYNASTDAIVNSATASGWITGDDVQVAATGQFADKNAGTDKTVTLTSSYSGDDTGNYVITNQSTTTASISQKAITISGITAANKVYNASTDAIVNSATASGWLIGDDVQVAATGQFVDKNVAANKVVNLTSSYSGEDAGNYVITDQASTTASITQKAITISGISAADKVYDATTAAIVNSATASGWITGDDVQVAATGQFADKNAAADKVVNLTSSYSGEDAGNYVITDQASTTASIDRRSIKVTADNLGKDEGALDPRLTYQTGCGASTADCGLVDGESLLGELNRESGETAGNYAVQQGSVDDESNPNYDIDFKEGTLVIAKVDIPDIDDGNTGGDPGGDSDNDTDGDTDTGSDGDNEESSNSHLSQVAIAVIQQTSGGDGIGQATNGGAPSGLSSFGVVNPDESGFSQSGGLELVETDEEGVESNAQRSPSSQYDRLTRVLVVQGGIRLTDGFANSNQD